MSCSPSPPPTPDSLAARRRQRTQKRAGFQLSLMIATGALLGGLGAIATHGILDRSTPSQSLSQDSPPSIASAPASAQPPSAPTPAASVSPELAIAPATALAPGGVLPKPADQASFTPMAMGDLNAEPTAQSPLTRLWIDPLQEVRHQVEAINIAHLAKSGAIPKQFQGKVIYGGGLSNDHKVVALTFDDGPWPETTAAVMNLLKQHGGKGTFFVVGNLVQRYPDLLKRMVAEGHEVANHTWSHRTAYSSPAIAAREVDNTTAAIAKHTGFSTRIYRPPGGILNNGLVNYARNKGYAILMWSTDTLDWRHRQAGPIRQRILRSLQPGGVVLMHDGGGPRWATVKALSQVLPELKAKGYRFVTVSELLWFREQQARKAAALKAQAQTSN